MKDDIRPKGTVQVPCSGLGCVIADGEGYWEFWVDSLDPRLPNGPFKCEACQRLELCEAETGRKIKRVTKVVGYIDDEPSWWQHSYLFVDDDTLIPEKYAYRHPPMEVVRSYTRVN